MSDLASRLRSWNIGGEQGAALMQDLHNAADEIDRAHGLLGSILDELALAFPGKHKDIDPIRDDIKLFLQTKDTP